MFKRVLVPLDGSMLAELALEPALHLAQHADGTVYLMRVPVYSDSGAQTSPEYHRIWADDNTIPEYEDAAAYLRETRTRIAQPGVTVRIVVGEGERANAIINTAVTSDVDLITMASHSRSGVTRWLLGSVADKVIRQMQSPVMLVRQPSEYNHVLITLDGSKVAEHIVETALALATAFRSRITFLQVDDGLEAGLQAGATTADNKRSDSDKESYLEKIISRYGQRGLEIDALSVKGSAADSILSYAAQNNVDLIAMSMHGRSGLRKLIFGSVTEKIMGDCGCAILIVRPEDQGSSK